MRALKNTERAEVRVLTRVVATLACVQLPCTSISQRNHTDDITISATHDTLLVLDQSI